MNMKRKLTIILAVLVAIAAVIVGVRIRFNEPLPKGSQDEQVKAILERSDCLVCHSQEPSLPFYAKFPVIGPMMNGHITAGYRFLDLGSELENADGMSEAALSKLEHAVTYSTMPIHEYRMIHWTSGLNKAEKELLSSWIVEKQSCEQMIQPIASRVEYDEAKAELGERMFNDTALSLDGTISCATCHVLEDGGADHED